MTEIAGPLYVVSSGSGFVPWNQTACPLRLSNAMSRYVGRAISPQPITTPLMINAGFDPVWFGVLVVILMETAMVTPPVGINLFVVQGVRGRGQLHDVIVGSAPFVVTLILMIALICVFPQMVLWLPQIAR